MRLSIATLISTGLIAATSLFQVASATAQIARPKITGISHLAVYASDMKVTDHFYADLIGAARMTDPEDPKGARYMLSPTQFIEVLPLPANAGINRMDHTAFNTDSASGMLHYLNSKGWKTPTTLVHESDGSVSFRVLDPEKNLIEFVQPPAKAAAAEAPKAPGHHIIHVGFLVHSRANEDKFYLDLLGFRPYWFGGMKDDKIDWVSLQTPDSHDWLEYMVSGDPATLGIPPTMSQQTLGVLDHFSIGVVSVPESFKKLSAENRLTFKNDGHTQIGRDGKYQFNMYDPDGIRLELMEFHATEKPCCSPFTATDPAE